MLIIIKQNIYFFIKKLTLVTKVFIMTMIMICKIFVIIVDGYSIIIFKSKLNYFRCAEKINGSIFLHINSTVLEFQADYDLNYQLITQIQILESI